MVEELEWVHEGFRQLRLGLAWQRYARLLAGQPAVAAVGATPTAWIDTRILPPLLEAGWLPGVRAVFKSHKTWDANVPIGEFSLEPFDLMEQSFCRALQGTMKGEPHDARPATDFWPPLRGLMFACYKDAVGEQALGTLPPLPPLYLPAVAQVRAWLRMSSAVAAWFALTPALSQLGSNGVQNRLTSLSETCGQIRAALVDRDKHSSLLARFSGKNRQLQQLLDQSAKVLHRCHEELSAVGRTLANGAGHDHLRLLSTIRGLVERPADWPPRLLAALGVELVGRFQLANLTDLVEELRAAAEREGTWEKRLQEKFGLPTAPPPGQARAALAVLLLEECDRRERACPLPVQVWDEVRACVVRLLDAVDLKAELVRTAGGTEGLCRREEGDTTGEQVLTTGLTVRSAAGEVGVLRHAHLLVPRRPSSLEAALTACANLVAEVEPALERLCRDTAAAVHAKGGLAHWLAGLDGNGRANVWRILQRAAALATLQTAWQAAVVPLLDEFKKAGFTLTPLPAAGGPTMLVTDERVREAVRLPTTLADGQGLGLRLPDGSVVAPALWLCLPESWARKRPLLRCLAESEPLLAGLKVLDPNWEYWQIYNYSLWRLVYAAPETEAESQSDVHAIKKALIVLKKRGQEQTALAAEYLELARRLYRCVTEEIGMRLVPELDPQTLRPLPLRGPPTDGTRVVFKPSPNKTTLGEVLHITRYGSPGHPGHIDVSDGGGLSPALVAWLGLPPPVFEGLAHSPHLVNGHPLPGWYEELQRLPWEPDRVQAALTAQREAFRVWVVSPQGLEWFNRFVQELRQEPAPEPVQQARAWLSILQQQRWCACVPAVEFATGAITWPVGMTTTVPGVSWEYSDNLQVGRALPDRPVVFAPSAAKAAGTFSLGPRRPGSALDLAYRLAEAVGPEPLRGPVEALLAATRAHSLAETAVEHPETLALAVLDTLATTDLPRATGAGAARWAAWLDVLRAWCATCGLEVLPRRWVPGTPPPETTADEAEVLPPAFGEGAAGSTRLVGLGLCAGAHVWRRCVVASCAGPAPLHYDEITALLAPLTQPGVAELRSALAQWAAPPADELIYKIIDFFTHLWKALGQHYRDQNPEAFERLETLVNELLEHQHLAVFYPTKLQNHPIDWLTLQGQGGVKTGRVRRVLQPGLTNPDGSLRVRAIIEVE